MSPRHRSRGHRGHGGGSANPEATTELNGTAAAAAAGAVAAPGAKGAAAKGAAPATRRPSRPRPRPAPQVRPEAAPAVNGAAAENGAVENGAAPNGAVAEGEEQACESGPRKAACTLAQMRRFIKSRPYVPVHELRRRFEIEGVEDEVYGVSTAQGTLYVGLPPEEAGYLGELIRSGDVGCEMLLDPVSPAVIGVYAMRPVARQ